MPRAQGSLINLGASHHTAPIEIREKFSISAERMADLYQSIRKIPGLREAVVLTTCNRTEMYAVVDNEDSIAPLGSSLCLHQDLEPDALARHGFEFREGKAARHLFEVAAGLDSMVVGETEILGQVKGAYTAAGEHHALGPFLNRLFQKSFQAAKWVRTHTAIGRGQVSVGTVAVDLALKIFGDLRACRVLVVGAGEISERTITALKNRGAATFTVCNRTDHKAMDLASQYGGSALPFDQLRSALSRFDIVICSTSSRDAILTPRDVGEAMKARAYQPLFLIDLAIPRDVEGGAGAVENVFLYNIDDLSRIADENLALRRSEVARCREILARRAEHFWKSTTRP